MTLPRVGRYISTVVSVLGLGIFWLIICAGFFLEFGMNQTTAVLTYALLMLWIIGGAAWVSRRWMQAGDDASLDYVNLGIQRCVLALFMVKYGLPKIYGNFFDYQLFAVDSPLGAVSEFELAWYLYGLNPWQELLAGVLEFVPGLMLLHRRTYYLGAVLLLPVVGQVFLLNLFFTIGGLTLPIASVLLACNIAILWSEKTKIMAFIDSLNVSPNIHLSTAASISVRIGRWTVIALAVTFIGAQTFGEFHRTDTQNTYDALVGAYTLERLTQNGTAHDPGRDHRFYKDLYIERQSRWNILRRFDDQTDAFILQLSEDNGFSLLINANGIGDRPDRIVNETAFSGHYRLKDGVLTLTGTQGDDQLEMRFVQRGPEPKTWFW